MSNFPKNVTITFFDGTMKNFPAGTTGTMALASMGHCVMDEVLAMKVNGVVRDLETPLSEDATVHFLTWEAEEGKQVFWHSSSHLLAEALERLYPSIKLGIGPPIEAGFYYDIDFGDLTFDHTHLARIEDEMRRLLKKKQIYRRRRVSKEEALAFFKERNNTYKVELIDGLEDGSITFYEQGGFIDLCKGPHLPSTQYIKAFKLLNIAGAYWRGDIKRKQLIRIYGISFPKEHMLEEFLVKREEAKKRDHRKLGKRLQFFTFSEEVGMGLPLWLPKGAFIRERLIQFLHETQKEAGYEAVVTPHIGHKNLYVTSGHYEKYKEGTFQSIKTPQKEEEFLLKPMNCPHHCVIYKTMPRSYKELPLRLAEFGTVYRYEQSGELHGLTRVRGFTQDDAHIFCRPDQVKEEFTGVVDLVQDVLKKFAFQDYTVQISLRDPDRKDKYMGGDSLWETAERAIQKVVADRGIKAKVQLGEAAFYGPKLDFLVRDALGREWQLGTVQMDYLLPERFDMSYVGQDNAKHRPVMIHRAPFGSLERFIAILLEHTAGKLPLWLTPEQVVVLPISEGHVSYARGVFDRLKRAGVRAKVDIRNEKVGKKIRDAEVEKIPFMLLLGDQEVRANVVAVRKQGAGDQGKFSLEAFVQLLREEEGMGS